MSSASGFQRIGVISTLPQVLWELGVDPNDVFQKAGLSRACIADPEASLSFDALDRLFDAAVRLTGCSHLGLLVGQNSSLAYLGLIGELMRHAPTARQALIDMSENQHRYVRGAVVYLIDDGETTMFGYGIYQPDFRNIDQLIEGAIAAGTRFVRELAPSARFEVCLPRPAPAGVPIYERILKMPVRFGQEQAALVFETPALDAPVPDADPARRKMLEGLVQAYWALREPTTTDMLRRILRPLILTGRADFEGVADRLEVHPRTLHRRLQQEGTTFRKIVEEEKFCLARQLLAGTDVTITQLALWLGYSEAAAFAHAFRRWAGTSAAGWRDAARAGEVASAHVA
ncbi:AraC family transcriptional regulator ligand-binding domain-containing protein [Alsobacter sp. SYSU M60028]|uniref:AraC family transcriptional regulator ligand-binding domain-containing protein n=1 Tax=Alsobacter ponti TaxID=2962936 RepID=A0ABT1LD37_9HYPH|nr:AraC family transcriptional regulator [Alsobacter ponti]MCP8939412.1 AraC family transcriptional regulator ligand-binding domain-containing protein [Alsobacter ponti]